MILVTLLRMKKMKQIRILNKELDSYKTFDIHEIEETVKERVLPSGRQVAWKYPRRILIKNPNTKEFYEIGWPTIEKLCSVGIGQLIVL